jgi:hypothetical protein
MFHMPSISLGRHWEESEQSKVSALKDLFTRTHNLLFGSSFANLTFYFYLFIYFLEILRSDLRALLLIGKDSIT